MSFPAAPLVLTAEMKMWVCVADRAISHTLLWESFPHLVHVCVEFVSVCICVHACAPRMLENLMTDVFSQAAVSSFLSNCYKKKSGGVHIKMYFWERMHLTDQK